MSLLRNSPSMAARTILPAILLLLFLLVHFSAFSSAQKSPSSSWKTLDGKPPLVIARGGFSGLFPDSSALAYNLAMMTSVPDVALWCDVQLTKDGAGICFPTVNLDNSSDVNAVYQNRSRTYMVNGLQISGFFPVDFTLKELASVFLTQGIYSRSPDFDNLFPIMTVEDVFTQNKPRGFWLNVQYDAFYNLHKLSMRRFLIGSLKKVIISHISSPEVQFLRSLKKPFASTKTKLIFRFLEPDLSEPSTNQSYRSLLQNLTFIKTFASGILVPKSYIWLTSSNNYLSRHTFLVADAHKAGLEIFAADFANDVVIAYNYSYDPVAEYLSFFNQFDFSVDGVLSDFPITPSAARDCFFKLDNRALPLAKPLVISHGGASGDYPSCTDVSYRKAILDGADVVDCPVQMSMDGIPFCLSSINLMNATLVGQTQFRTLLQTIDEFQSSPGIYSFKMNWTDIEKLIPVISNPNPEYRLIRNPDAKYAGKLISLTNFLEMTKNESSLSAILIKIENAEYLASEQGLSVTDAVLNALDKAGYNSPNSKKVMIQSTSSSVLKTMNGKKYELVYEVQEKISGVPNDIVLDIKTFAHSVVVYKPSVLPKNEGFLTTLTDTVSDLQAGNLSVYVQVFRNEFVTQAYDFFSDPVVEIHSFVMEGKIDGVITDFPQTAARYKKNSCLNMKDPPIYMSSVQPGLLIRVINPQVMPPAEAPSPLLSESDLVDPPLPPVTAANATAPEQPPPSSKPSRSGQPPIAASQLICSLPIILIVIALLF